MAEFRYYTGVGSRETPEPILQRMIDIARLLNHQHFFLRSGGADGADSAFEVGAGKDKQIWVPWYGFNGSRSFNTPQEWAFDIASTLHPAWDKLDIPAQKLHARNVHQIMGREGEEPSKFVICWTPEGKIIGGTATAIRLANRMGIRVFNLAVEDFDFSFALQWS